MQHFFCSASFRRIYSRYSEKYHRNVNHRSVKYRRPFAEVSGPTVKAGPFFTETFEIKIRPLEILFLLHYVCKSLCFNFLLFRCPRDTTLEYSYNPTGSSQRLKMRTFRFFSDYDTVFIHCELFACRKNSLNSR